MHHYVKFVYFYSESLNLATNKTLPGFLYRFITPLNFMKYRCNKLFRFQDFVGPAKYDIAWSFDRVRNRKCRNFGDVPFNSSGPRSTTPATKVGVPCTLPPPPWKILVWILHFSGSTSYELELSLCKPGFHFARDWRFKCEEETPGPGSYNVSYRFLRDR
jgi:hypothetical protein